MLLINLGSAFRTRTRADRTMTLNTESWLVGAQTGYLVSEPTAETHMMGVSFHAWGAYPFFRTQFDTVTDRTVEASALWPPAFVAGLRHRLAEAASLADRFAVLEAALLERLDSRANGFGLVRHVLMRLSAPGAGEIGALATDLGFSHKHLIDTVRRVTGLTPSRFMRIARMDRLLEVIDPTGPVRWDRLAHAADYYDQAHFNRDFRAFTGVTPTAYLAQRRALYGAEASPDNAHFIPFTEITGDDR